MEVVLAVLEAFGSPLGVLVGWAIVAIISATLAGTKYKKWIKLLIGVVATKLEKEKLDVPDFLHQIIMTVHSVKGDTTELESMLIDEEEKYEKK